MGPTVGYLKSLDGADQGTINPRSVQIHRQ